MSRRSKRYQNRQIERMKKKEHLKVYDNFDNICSLQSLYTATKKASNGVKWKSSVQKYMVSLLFNINKTRHQLKKGEDIRQGFSRFVVNERGKKRDIRAVRFPERVVQKSGCLNSFYPMLTSNIIQHNSASQSGKGVDYCLDELEKQLRRHIRRYGTKGYILLTDFKGYFENIDHDTIKNIFRAYYSDPKILKLADDFVDAFEDTGLGLGSETSQINAIIYINKIDHFIKEKLGIKGYGRYMDDSYLIHQDKEYLKECRKILEEKLQEYKVIINAKKTRLVKITKPFTFLKTRFFITETGKIIKKPCRCSITRQRRRLKKQIKLYNNPEIPITLTEIKQSYYSWRGSMKRRHARKTVYNMDKLYNSLYLKETIQ